MSETSGAASWLEPTASGTGVRNGWLACLIALTALLVFCNLANDARLDVNYGWDVRVNCAAVDAHVAGLDPYFVKNLKGTKLSYPYLPVTLAIFRPLCAGGVLVSHFKTIFPLLALLCGLCLPGLGATRTTARDVMLRLLFTFGAFVGFEWVQASGNFAILSGLLTAVALRLLLRPLRSDAQADERFAWRLSGAALLGLVTSFKLVFFPVLAALYLLPLTRGRKLALLAVAGLGFGAPILVSKLLYPELFASWQLAMAAQIPDQHFVDLLETNPSLLLLAQSLLHHAGLGDGKPALFATYGLAVLALIAAPFALAVLRAVRSHPAAGEKWSLARLDLWLMRHPRSAMRITALAMFALYLSSPRLKEYAFFELALYAAILIVDLPAMALAAILTVGIALPTSISLLAVPFEGSFILLVAAVISYWIILSAFWSEPERPAQG